ncbi:MAG TPA: metallophosphoesterase [Acidimicrobiia bacterium]|nr:metallophosphoesterase [Acidimicrobiia bacterium]
MRPFEFIFLADTQLGCYATFSGLGPEEIAAYAARGMTVREAPPTTGYEWDARQYRKAVAAINRIGPRFVAVGGDLIDDAGSDAQADEFLAITATIDDDIDVRFVPGNHDIAPDALIPTTGSIDRYRQVFGPDHYSFRHEGSLFVVLNTPVIDHPEQVPDEWQAQLGFLEDELEQAAERGVDQIVLLGHHPLFLEAPTEPDTYWNLPGERRAPIRELIDRFGVSIGFAGHWHRNAIATDGRYVQVTSGPVGYPLGDDPSGYRLVEVGRSDIAHRYVPLDD